MTGSPLSPSHRVLAASVAITAVMALVFVGLGLGSGAPDAVAGWQAAAVASGVCWLSGLMALAALVVCHDPQQALTGVFLGMLCRLGLSLLVGFALLQSGSPLVKAGVLGMIVVAYLAGLLVETAMAWWILGRSSSGTSLDSGSSGGSSSGGSSSGGSSSGSAVPGVAKAS